SVAFKEATNFAPVPFIKTEERVFTDSLYIDLAVVALPQNETIQTYQIYYQIDEQKWQVYHKPFYIKQNTHIAVKASFNKSLAKGKKQVNWSATVHANIIKKDPNVQLQLNSTYSNQYAASGKNALIDGLRGGNEFRTGDFQGYYNQDIVAVVAFTEAKTIEAVGVSFIRDQKAWIFAPRKITVEASLNGKDYFTIAQQELPEAMPTDKNPFKDEVLIELNNDKQLKYKSLRYTVSNPGLLPNWHLGAGNPTWLFIDELLYK
ncbi:MAG: hypothetical protein RI948_1328, partial [Bacteroidota bacterium]